MSPTTPTVSIAAPRATASILVRTRSLTGLAVGLAAGAAFGLTGPAAAGDVPTFTDATDTRLVAENAVGAGDSVERDYVVADLDNDGDDDLVVARRLGLNGNGGQPRPNVLFMNEGGVLTDRTAELAPDLGLPERSRDVAAADVNGDGFVDVVVFDGAFEQPKLLLNRGNDGGGVWLGLELRLDKLPLVLADGWSGVIGDAIGDGDGFPDIFIGTRSGNDKLFVNLGERDGKWLGFSDGSSRLGTNAATPATRSVELVDINGDGDLDLVQGVTNPAGACRIIANDGTGMFDSTPQEVTANATYNFTTADMDGDGDLDVYSVRNGSDVFTLNEGSSGETVNFAASVTVPSTNGFGSIVRAVDLDGNGFPDFLVCDLDQEFPADCSRRLKIYFNDGSGTALVQGYPGAGADWTPNGTSDVAPMDLDGDGDLDLIIGHCGGTSVFLQDGGDTGGDPDLDGDGDVDFEDLLSLLAAWGPCDDGVPCPADLDGSGAVDFSDLLAILAAWQ